MKNLILYLLVAIASISMTACGSMPIAQQSGKEDTCSLVFVSQGQHVGEMVSVQLDNTSFEAKTVSYKKATRKGIAYSVAPGTRSITVKDEQGNVIYSKKIFLSTQETKQIQLP
ncbi:MAG: hypothetical protein K6E86_02335 [Bacteroidales bacterium]|nr:hypothetical protein [Bacteroidales bacterium]